MKAFAISAVAIFLSMFIFSLSGILPLSLWEVVVSWAIAIMLNIPTLPLSVWGERIIH